MASAERPARRAATRRKVVVDDDNSSDMENTSITHQDEEEDFTPAPAKSARASPRRRTTNNVASAATTPRQRVAAGRKAKTGDSIIDSSALEPSQIFSPPESVVADTAPGSPTKKAAPKRRTVAGARAARKSRVSIAPDATETTMPPTPEPTVSPEPISRQATPLADITETTVNERTPKATHRRVTPIEEGITSIADVTENAPTPKPEPRPVVRNVDATVTKLERPMDIALRTLNSVPPHSQHPLVPEAPKARMTITYLTLTNFKSYAGKQTVGPFHASFSSVVGPNGSGKSNVIDSLLFVFGFRASKMRQGKISALIHNSARYPDLGHCEVEVHFQNVMDLPGGGSEVVPNSGLVVSRRAFKNNSSKYFIDGRASDFTTVTTLLKDRGIDLTHKRFLILQGEVESIAQMKPKALDGQDDGLLEYLEDIIGTSRFKSPIEEAATETEALNEVCAEKQTRVQHVEKEKTGLEDKKNKALKYIEDENELASKQSSLYQMYVAECGDNITVTEEALTEVRAKLEEELQRHGGSEDAIKALEKRHKAGSKELAKLEESTHGVLQEMKKLEKERVKFEEKRKFLANKSKKLAKALETAEFGEKEQATLAERADDDIVRLGGEIEELEAEMQAEEKELTKVRESLKGKTQGLSDQIAAKQKLLEPWNAKVSEKQSAIAVATSELDILRERASAGATAVHALEGKIAGLREQRDAKAAELENCSSKRRAAEKEIGAAQKSIEKIAAQEPALRAKLSSSRAKADEARASLVASSSQSSVLSALTRLSASGRIDGFHGRLGNLGVIDAKYDVAISTACPSLDNLVVDTVEGGQGCIDYLRKNNLGRANFILLDRLTQRDLSPVDTPESVPRLFDLVKAKEERFRPAFYSVLQNTLVAKDLEQANRIAYGAKRWRVVTLDGQLIDKSGTMSGGGTKVARGGMSSKLTAEVTKEQVSKMEVDREEIEREFATLQDKRQDLEEQLRSAQGELPRLETGAQKLGLEVESLDRNIADAEKRIEELGVAAAPSKAEKGKISSLEKSIDTLQSEIEKLQQESSGLEDEIEVLQAKIMEVGGLKLRSQKGKVDGLREQIETLGESLSAAEVAGAKARKGGEKHGRDMADASKEIAKVEKDAQKVEDDAARQTKETSGFRRQAEDAEQALGEKREELGEVKAELDALVAELNETRGVEVEMRNQLEANEKVLAESSKRLRYWQEKLSKLSLQVFSEEGEEKDREAMPELSRDELMDLDKDDLKAAIALLEEKTSVHVELAVLAEYRRRVNEHTTRLADLTDSLTARDAAKSCVDSLRKQRLEGFMTGFSLISQELKTMYQMITMGGNAELELVDSLDPFSEGILFSVMPPKKSWKNIGNLSGGEKTLSSLALVFALHHYRPTPLYVMDEIDAALDFRNVSCCGLVCSGWDGVLTSDVCRSRLWRRISRSARRMRSSLSFRCGTTCLSWRQDWWGCTKSTIWYVAASEEFLRYLYANKMRRRRV